MPKSYTKVQIRPDSSTPDIRGSHAHFVESLKGFRPDLLDPRLQANTDELVLRAELVGCTLRAVERYVIALMRDTADHAYALTADRQQISNTFDDLISDLRGNIERAAETAREERAYFGRAA